VVGGVEMPAGEYAVLCKPTAKEWMLMFYPYESGNWGSYLDKEPAGTVSVKPETNDDMIERMRFTVEDIEMDGANIVFAWDKTMIKIPVEVHTAKQVEESIASVMSGPSKNDYYAAASYYHDMGENMDQALEWINKATEGDNPKFWQVRRKAMILADMGKKKEAIMTAKQSMKLAEAAGNEDYVRMNKASIAEWSK
jgi:tetratricopeptide (TPR) repeat protein